MPSISSPLWVNSVHFAHMHSLLSSADPYLGAMLRSYTWVPKESVLLYVLIQPWPWRNSGELCELETQPKPPVAKAPSLPGLDWVGSLQDFLFLSPCSIWRHTERERGGRVARGWWEVTIDPVVFLKCSPQRGCLALKGTVVLHCRCHEECHHGPWGGMPHPAFYLRYVCKYM